MLRKVSVNHLSTLVIVYTGAQDRTNLGAVVELTPDALLEKPVRIEDLDPGARVGIGPERAGCRHPKHFKECDALISPFASPGETATAALRAACSTLGHVPRIVPARSPSETWADGGC